MRLGQQRESCRRCRQARQSAEEILTHQDTIVWSLAFGDVDLPAVSAPPIPTPWDCDVNRSGTVDLTDVLVVLGTWGPCSFSCAADLDEDGVVGFPDLLSVLEHFGW